MTKYFLKNLLQHIKKTHVLFAIIAIATGVVFIKITPPLWGIDEVTHFSRVYQLSEGHLRAVKKVGCNGVCYGDGLPTNLTTLSTYVYGDLTDNNVQTGGPFYLRKDVNNPGTYKSLGEKKFNQQKIYFAFTGAGTYSPLAYIGPLAGTVAAKLLHLNISKTIFLARLGTLLIYVAMAYVALRLLKDYKARWLLFVVALIPEVIYQASIVSVDSLTMGEALVLFAVLLRLWALNKGEYIVLKRWLLGAITLLAIILPLSKPNLYILLLPIAFIPNGVWRHRILAVSHKAAVLLVSLMAMAFWAFATSDNAKAGASVRFLPVGAHISAGDQVVYMLQHPVHAVAGFLASFVAYGYSWPIDFFGYLGWNYVEIPFVSIALPIVLTVAVLYSARIVQTKRQLLLGWLMLGTGVLATAGVLGAFYLAFTPVGKAVVDGVQGRYFLPVSVFVLYGLALVIPAKLELSRRCATAFFSSASALCLIFSIAVYYTALY